MITRAADAIFRVWDDHRQQPFWRMVQLFVARIFRGGGDSDTEGLDLGIGLVLTLLALPGGFVSLFLLNKYGTLLQWLRGIKNVDTLAVVLLPIANAALGFIAFYSIFDSSGADWAGPWLAVAFAAFYLLMLQLPAR